MLMYAGLGRLHTLRREIGTAVAICCMALLMVVPKVGRHSERLPVEVQAATAHGVLQLTTRGETEAAKDAMEPAQPAAHGVTATASCEGGRPEASGSVPRPGRVPLRL